MMPISPAEPERVQTEGSLAGERARADVALAAKAAVEHVAEAVIERAREQADQVLANARQTADENLSISAARHETESAIATERRKEDQLIDDLRAKADDTLRREREASARVLARLIPIERDRTDHLLQVERARSDDAVANRDDFLAMVTHDLRDLLHGVNLHARLIENSASKGKLGQESLLQAQGIQRSVGRMTRLLGDLVDIASIDSGKLAILPSDGDAAATVADAIETWTIYARQQGIDLQALAEGRMPARFDHERVLQILGNLITNAVKFSKKGGTVVVGVERTGSHVRFFVKDTGVGISEADKEAVFERFWQIGKGDRRGLGLGLYISRCVVEASGGEIWVESTLGAGSTFFFTISCAG